MLRCSNIVVLMGPGADHALRNPVGPLQLHRHWAAACSSPVSRGRYTCRRAGLIEEAPGQAWAQSPDAKLVPSIVGSPQGALTVLCRPLPMLAARLMGSDESQTRRTSRCLVALYPFGLVARDLETSGFP
ncbi:hypothetical protein CMUS01_03926 [Colletotrichum musicola]|uniref:Uncharacterized protein n=1 Tax=Colletotrichum musicola TaxID=2175873 RepID=A0A8H6U3P2_9PEZI|nr:hypothetical protein CMUS01_03926 [Colletotrichum musicola]